MSEEAEVGGRLKGMHEWHPPEGLVVLIVLILNPQAIVRQPTSPALTMSNGTTPSARSVEVPSSSGLPSASKFYASRGSGDPRFTVMQDVTLALRSRGHTVLLSPAKEHETRAEAERLSQKEFGVYAFHRSPKPDVVLTWWAYRWTKWIDTSGDPAILRYENGLTRGDLVVDPGGLLGASAYVDRLQHLMAQDYDDATCSNFLAKRLASGAWSKRPQMAEDESHLDVPTSIRGSYIFVPTQHMNDLSISLFSNISMFGLLKDAAFFAKSKDLPVVIKIHPHIEDLEKDQQRKFIDLHLRRRIGAHVIESDASIGFLTANAKFTLTLNGGTIMDNFYTQSPVVTAAYSMFWKTDAVIFDPDPRRGMETVLTQGWNETRKLRQRQAACWVARMSLNVDKSPEENVEVIQRHLDLRDGRHLSLAPTPSSLLAARQRNDDDDIRKKRKLQRRVHQRDSSRR